MENQVLDDLNYSSSENGLQVNNEIKNYLYETAKWGKFLAIMGFIFIALIAFAGIGAAFFMSNMSGEMGGAYGAGSMVGFALIYIIIAAIYLYPTLKLYKFSTKTKTALENHTQMDFAEAFSNLKSLFKFMGISTLIILGFYALIILMGGLSFLGM